MDVQTRKPRFAASLHPDPVVLDQLHGAEQVALVLSGSLAGLVLAGWLIPGLALVWPSAWSLMKLMKANTALLVVLIAAGLALPRSKQNTRWTILRRVLAGLVIGIAGTAIFEHWSGQGTAVSTLLASDRDAVRPGLMSLQSAISLALLGVAMLIDVSRSGPLGALLDALCVLLVSCTLVLTAGYVFNAHSFVGPTPTMRMSPQTLICVALLTFVVTSRRAPHGAFASLVGIGIGSKFARLVLPLAVLLAFSFILGGATLLASGKVTLPYAAAITASSMAIVLVGAVVLLAAQINRLEEDLRSQSLSDELTGLHNRRGFYLLGEQAVRDARRSAKPVTVLYMDVDELKRVNDTLGHDVGSELLRDVARLLRSTFRASDVVGRLGGDEFAVFAHDSDDDLTPRLERLQTATDAINQSGEKPYLISYSVGRATSRMDSNETFAKLVERADAAMYRQKREHRAGGSMRDPVRQPSSETMSR
jgi:diguanylate cyclase (GGDEF)-like protein